MRVASEESTSGSRHETLESICAHLHHMVVGAAAATMLETPGFEGDADCGLWVAPSWVWLRSKVDIGRKDRSLGGGRMLMPVRLQWETSLQVVPVGEPTVFEWSMNGMGHTGSGTTAVSVHPVRDHQSVELDGGPVRAEVPMMTSHQVGVELRRLVDAGNQARWALVTYFEPYVLKAVMAAHRSVAEEFKPFTGFDGPVLDETKLGSIADTMMLGEGDHPGQLAKLLAKCVQPDTFARVDPVRYIRVAIMRDSNAAVRRALGDPHIGPKVRRVALETGTADDVDRLVEAYRCRYPADRLSVDRARAALGVGADAMAVWGALEGFDREFQR